MKRAGRVPEPNIIELWEREEAHTRRDIVLQARRVTRSESRRAWEPLDPFLDPHYIYRLRSSTIIWIVRSPRTNYMVNSSLTNREYSDSNANQ